VEWILARLRGRNRARAGLVCYLRENGPIAYSTDIFGADPRERVEAMLATGLTWHWRSAGHEPIAREWTNLSRWSLAALLEDLAAQHDGHHADILIIGVEDDGGEPADAITDARIAEWMRGFGAASTSPLHAVVTRPAPGGDLLFVAQQPPESVRTLLHDWGISRDKAIRKAYPRLQANSLEELIRKLSPR
jgi:hypothetical protein